MDPVNAESLPVQKGTSAYPSPFAARVAGRAKRKLGDLFGLSNFGVNLTQLDPGAVSALLHSHAVQDEFIYILAGTATLRIGSEEHEMRAGDCYGFKAGTGEAHQLLNRSQDIVSYLEIGDRSANERVEYPEDDLRAVLADDGSFIATHKDGRPY